MESFNGFGFMRSTYNSFLREKIAKQKNVSSKKSQKKTQKIIGLFWWKIFKLKTKKLKNWINILIKNDWFFYIKICSKKSLRNFFQIIAFSEWKNLIENWKIKNKKLKNLIKTLIKRWLIFLEWNFAVRNVFSSKSLLVWPFENNIFVSFFWPILLDNLPIV